MMGKITAFESVTLDGVMQAPARADEDPRGGFEHGGWAVRYADESSGRFVGKEGAGGSGGLLLGRRTYLDFFDVWPNRTDNPFTERLNSAQKYVASRTLEEPLPWVNSTLLKGDAAKAVAQLKQEISGDFVVLGSGDLLQSLMRHDLVDEFVLLIHPLLLGCGRKLFVEGLLSTSFELTSSSTTSTGVIIATYQRPNCP